MNATNATTTFQQTPPTRQHTSIKAYSLVPAHHKTHAQMCHQPASASLSSLLSPLSSLLSPLFSLLSSLSSSYCLLCVKQLGVAGYLPATFLGMRNHRVWCAFSWIFKANRLNALNPTATMVDISPIAQPPRLLIYLMVRPIMDTDRGFVQEWFGYLQIGNFRTNPSGSYKYS